MYDHGPSRPASYTRDDVAVVEARHGARFAQKAVALAVVALGQDLDRDLAVEHDVDPAIDVRHPAAADHRVDPVPSAERLTGEGGHANAPR